MTKNILAIAIAAAVMAPSAFAAATVYGVAHVSGNSVSGVSGTTAATANGSNSTGMTAISSNSSRLGIKGDEDLGNGMKAVYQMEFGVAMMGESDTTGTAASKSSTDSFSTRNTFVGLGGGFGTVLAGRHDSLIKLAGRKYDLFGDQIGNNRNILGGGSLSNATLAKFASSAVDGRHNNVLAYVSPTWSNFHFGLAYVGGDAMTGGTADGIVNYDNASDTGAKHAALTAIADYDVGNFSVTAGYINIGNSSIGTGVAAEAYRLGAGYTFGAAKVVGLYQNSNVAKVLGQDKNQDTYGLGGSYKVGAAGTIKAQYYVASNVAAAANASNGGTLTTVGYDHAMSKNTTAYAAYSMAHNDAGASFTTDMANGGSGNNVWAVTGKDNSTVSVGLIHNF